MLTEFRDGSPKEVTLTSQDELLAMAIGMFILESFQEEAGLEASAHIGLMEFEGKKIRPSSPIFTFDLTRAHEQSVLDGLAWVSRTKETLVTKMFAADVAELGVERAFTLIDEIQLDKHLTKLAELCGELEEQGVIRRDYLPD